MHQPARPSALSTNTSRPTQKVIGTDRMRPVPSLHSLEQSGGPEVDGPLILPDKIPVSSRGNELLASFEQQALEQEE